MSDQTFDSLRVVKDISMLMIWRAIALVIFGVVFLVKPEVPLTLVVLVMGAYWLLDGILTVIKYFKKSTDQYRKVGLIIGSISILAGVIVLANPVASAFLTTTFLVYFLAFSALITGFTSLAMGFRLRKEHTNEGHMIIGGIGTIIFGGLLLASPLYSVLILVKFIGAIAAIVGVVMLVNALRLRSAVQNSTG